MAVTRRPQRQQTSVPVRKTKTPATIQKQANHSSRKQAGASRKMKRQTKKIITSAKPQEGSLSAKGKSRSIQPHKDNKSTVEANSSTSSPRVARNSTQRQSVLSDTFTKDKTPKKKVSRKKVGGRKSSNVEASSSQKSVLKEKNKPLNASSQSPKNEVHEDMNKNKAQSPSIMVAKKCSLQYSQLKSPNPPDSIKSRKKVVVEAGKKLRSKVKLHSVSKKVVKAKSVVARSSLRKFQRTSISVISTSTVKGYLNISNNADSPSISIADSGSPENSPANKTRSSLKPKNLFSDVSKNKKVDKHLSHGQNNISSTRSKNASIKEARIEGDSDIVKSDNILPKRKVHESHVKDNNALVSASPVKKSMKTDDVPSPKELKQSIPSNIAEKESKVEADVPKDKSPTATSSKGLKRSIGEKDNNPPGDSKSSKDETDEWVPSPKVKQSETKKKQDNVPSTQGVRRSVRERFPRCETWHGQRPLFQYKKGQGFVYVGISPGWKKDESARLAILKMQQRHKMLKAKKRGTSKSVHKTAVFDRSNKTEVDVTLHCPFDTVEWTSVAQGDKTPFRLTKTFVSEEITFGFLEIFPLERKGSQFSPQANIHFVVLRGRLKVKIHDTEFLFERCDSFIVPCAVAYSIENLEKSKALLSFSTFQIPFFSHQEKMND